MMSREWRAEEHDGDVEDGSGESEGKEGGEERGLYFSSTCVTLLSGSGLGMGSTTILDQMSCPGFTAFFF